MSNDDPSDPDEPRRGPVREFFHGFFDDFTCSDWIEFCFYAFAVIGVLVFLIVWLISQI